MPKACPLFRSCYSHEEPVEHFLSTITSLSASSGSRNLWKGKNLSIKLVQRLQMNHVNVDERKTMNIRIKYATCEK